MGTLIPELEGRVDERGDPPEHFFFLAREATQKATLNYPDVHIFAAIRMALSDLGHKPDDLLQDSEFLKYLDCLDE